MPLISSLAVVALCSLWNLAGLIALVRVTCRARPSRTAPPAPVSVFKPLNGADAGLYENLKSFFLQDHPNFELIFGATDPRDAALPIVERLQLDFPRVRSRVVIHPGGPALNPKVRNLLGMWPHAQHDLVLISDSNVRAPTHYVSELARIHATNHAGIVTNLFAGCAENTLGGALENVQLNGFCVAGSALPTLVGDAAVIGKSTLFSADLLQRLGGLERLSHVLAEDFILGKMFQNAGHPVVLAPTVLASPNANLSLRASFSRHLRWAMLRWRLRPAAALLEPITSPLLLLPLAWHALGPLAAVWFVLVLAIRDWGGWLALRGAERAWLPLLLAPVRELCAPLTWALGAFKRHVSWRGQRLRLSAGTLLYREAAHSR